MQFLDYRSKDFVKISMKILSFGSFILFKSRLLVRCFMVKKKKDTIALLLFVQTPFTLCITLCTKRYLLINDLIACMHVRLSVLNILILIEFRCIDFFF